MVSIIFAIFEFKFSELLWGWVLVNPVQPVLEVPVLIASLACVKADDCRAICDR